jgi:hypothetical protein
MRGISEDLRKENVKHMLLKGWEIGRVRKNVYVMNGSA